MSLYQKIQVSTGDPVGAPGPLPANLVGLADADLADLSWVAASEGFADTGFVPVAGDGAAGGRVITLREWMERLTTEELVAIETAADGDAAIRVWLRYLFAGPTVNLDAPRLSAALADLVAAELLTSERADALLA
ncbi:hypothetical protein [Phenylobacterium sp.]|uniref:hypothetical protein n=1 Tax=Phenylobacterium sp. TaxID=1871053 RepID=UPI00301BF7E4